MMYLAFILAAVLFVVASILLVLDSRRRHAGEPDHAPASAADAAADAEAEQTPEDKPALEEAEPQRSKLEQEYLAYAASLEAQAEELEKWAVAEQQATLRSVPVVEAEAEAEPEEEAEPEPQPEAEQETPQSEHAGTFRLGQRRARKQWAKQRRADYRRIDRELAGRWQRVPAGEAKSVVFGFAHGREMHVCDINQVTVVALRRVAASDEIVELRHSGESDLPTVGFESHLLMSASNPALVRRVLDQRARDFFATVPEFIIAMWAESDWLLAQLPRESEGPQWEHTLAVLSEFSDFARRLPPRPDQAVKLDPNDWDQTRELPQDREAQIEHTDTPPVESAHTPPATDTIDAIVETESPDTVASVKATDVVAEGIGTWRPTYDATLDPKDLPSRTKPRFNSATGAGQMASQSKPETVLGENKPGETSELPALGEDPEHMRSRITGGRIIRPTAETPDIFTDTNNKQGDD